MHTSALRWSGALCEGTHDEGLCANKTGSSAHLSIRSGPAQHYYSLGPTWQLTMAHGGNGTTAEAPLTLYDLWTPEARRRQMPPRTPPRRPPSLSTAAESVSWPLPRPFLLYSLSHVSFPGRFAQFLGSSLLA
jgi:hypothetical protein